MIPIYEEKKEKLYMVHKLSQHFPPHLHETPELIYLTNGTLELGSNQEFFHMEKGDLAVVFPNLVHHYQVFSAGPNSAVYLYPPLSMVGPFRSDLQKYSPKNPVISRKEVHPDIRNAIRHLERERSCGEAVMEDDEAFEKSGDLHYENKNPIVEQAYVQIILARSMAFFELEERRGLDYGDIVCQTVSYIAGHFKEDLSLDKVAKELAVSKYALSRIFSSTFHKNFNQYLNEQRLNYVCALLGDSEQSITEICLDAGFQSQRTFNRVFQETYKMTPREYRNVYKEKYVIQQQM